MKMVSCDSLIVPALPDKTWRGDYRELFHWESHSYPEEKTFVHGIISNYLFSARDELLQT